MDRSLLVYDDADVSLSGRCSHCQRSVDNHDELHRVSSIARGGRGVECVLRGDIEFHEARPLGHRPSADPAGGEGGPS